MEYVRVIVDELIPTLAPRCRLEPIGDVTYRIVGLDGLARKLVCLRVRHFGGRRVDDGVVGRCANLIDDRIEVSRAVSSG